jgi:hypothetical protein
MNNRRPSEMPPIGATAADPNPNGTLNSRGSSMLSTNGNVYDSNGDVTALLAPDPTCD